MIELSENKHTRVILKEIENKENKELYCNMKLDKENIKTKKF